MRFLILNLLLFPVFHHTVSPALQYFVLTPQVATYFQLSSSTNNMIFLYKTLSWYIHFTHQNCTEVSLCFHWLLLWCCYQPLAGFYFFILVQNILYGVSTHFQHSSSTENMIFFFFSCSKHGHNRSIGVHVKRLSDLMYWPIINYLAFFTSVNASRMTSSDTPSSGVFITLDFKICSWRAFPWSLQRHKTAT